MATGRSGSDWRRSIGRGAIIGAVVAAHTALVLWLLMPPTPQPRRDVATRASTNVLHVFLLAAPRPLQVRQPAAPLAHARPTPPPARPAIRAARPVSVPVTASSTPMSLALPGAAATSAAFLGGGTLNARLHAAQAPRQQPKLPSGNRYAYLAGAFAYVPVQQQSIEGRVNAVAGLIFGGFDPVCKNTEYELAKPRLQQMAEGYTIEELERRLKEHHCE